MEEYNLRVFIMVTHIVCGALPLGIIVTSDEKKPTLVDALELYQSATSDFGFYGATASGPQVFMTDNCYELNVVGLLDKLTTEFDQHRCNKLLSVASGKFDGIYSRRFKGNMKKKEGVGFQVPTVEDQKLAFENTSKVGENLFVVPSMSEEGESYLVDMNTGFCQCKIGLNGSPCKHQYLLWINKVSTSINFLPMFSKEQRQLLYS